MSFDNKPANPQSYNRYAYVLNRALNFTDPTGHREEDCENNACGLPTPSTPPQPANPLPAIPTGDMVTFDVEDGCDSNAVGEANCTWSQEEMDTIWASAMTTGRRLALTLNEAYGWNLSASEAFLLVYGGSVNFHKMGAACAEGCWGRSTGTNNINVYTDIFRGTVNQLVGDRHWAVHELGHSFVNATGGSLPLTQYENLQRVGYADRGGRCLSEYCGFAGDQWEWQRSGDGATSEEFADMFLGWVYSQWESGTTNGYQRSLFMNHMMPTYVDMTVNR